MSCPQKTLQLILSHTSHMLRHHRCPRGRQVDFDSKKMIKDAEGRMQKSVDKCKENLSTLRTGDLTQHTTALRALTTHAR
jgi:hypothetical protein